LPLSPFRAKTSDPDTKRNRRQVSDYTRTATKPRDWSEGRIVYFERKKVNKSNNRYVGWRAKSPPSSENCFGVVLICSRDSGVSSEVYLHERERGRNRYKEVPGPWGHWKNCREI